MISKDFKGFLRIQGNTRDIKILRDFEELCVLLRDLQKFGIVSEFKGV